MDWSSRYLFIEKIIFHKVTMRSGMGEPVFLRFFICKINFAKNAK